MPPKKISNPPCYECGEASQPAISQSEKNPGRIYFKCAECSDKTGKPGLWLGWQGEYEGKKPKFLKRKTFEAPEDSEEERPLKKAAISPPLPFMDKLCRDKLFQNSEKLEDLYERVQLINEKIDELLERTEVKGVEDYLEKHPPKKTPIQ